MYLGFGRGGVPILLNECRLCASSCTDDISKTHLTLMKVFVCPCQPLFSLSTKLAICTPRKCPFKDCRHRRIVDNETFENVPCSSSIFKNWMAVVSSPLFIAVSINCFTSSVMMVVGPDPFFLSISPLRSLEKTKYLSCLQKCVLRWNILQLQQDWILFLWSAVSCVSHNL